MPNMEHARPRLEFDLTAHCSQALGHSDRIIAQCLVAADMNESRWQARQIAVKRRGVGRARISASEIKVDQIGRASCRERVEISVGGGAVKKKREIVDG